MARCALLVSFGLSGLLITAKRMPRTLSSAPPRHPVPLFTAWRSSTMQAA